MLAFAARGIRLALQASCLLVLAVSLFGQRGPGVGASAPTATGVGSNNRGTLNPNTTSPNSTRGSTEMQPVFLSGQVIFADGATPNPNVRIERICATGGVRLLAHTDSKGYFSVQVGQPDTSEPDASDQSPGMRPGGPAGFGGSNSGIRRFGTSESCDIRASYPGYRSDTVSLGFDRYIGSGDRLTLTLHPLTNVHGTTISVTTAMAPKNAQKAYDKGMQLAAKGKLEDAAERFSEATTIYPRYAIAWFALGQVQQRERHAPDAQKSYQLAISADSHYVSPYDQLALLAAEAGNWEDSAALSKKAIDLNPVEFPSSFWYNALANYNLKRFPDAENSVRQLLKLDSSNRYAEAHKMLARILLDKNDTAGAADQMRAYLAAAPNAKDADALKQDLAKLTQANTPAPPAK